jgi:hypothetical protein
MFCNVQYFPQLRSAVLVFLFSMTSGQLEQIVGNELCLGVSVCLSVSLSSCLLIYKIKSSDLQCGFATPPHLIPYNVWIIDMERLFQLF